MSAVSVPAVVAIVVAMPVVVAALAVMVLTRSMVVVSGVLLIVAAHRRRVTELGTDLRHKLVEFAAVEPHAAAGRAVVDLDRLAFGHQQIRRLADWAFHDVLLCVSFALLRRGSSPLRFSACDGSNLTRRASRKNLAYPRFDFEISAPGSASSVRATLRVLRRRASIFRPSTNAEKAIAA